MALAVLHAAGDIDDQIAAEIRGLLELFDVQPVLPRPDLPIDMPQVIAGRILTVLKKLNALPKVRTAMHAREKTLDDILRPKLHSRNSLDGFRMQKSFGIGHRWKARLRGRGFALQEFESHRPK